jgi:hypothetical protein
MSSSTETSSRSAKSVTTVRVTLALASLTSTAGTEPILAPSQTGSPRGSR